MYIAYHNVGVAGSCLFYLIVVTSKSWEVVGLAPGTRYFFLFSKPSRDLVTLYRYIHLHM
jgi:hypothetical protein